MISVIVPVYRTEKYLKRCVNSIINQTYKDLEIILVDDGSDDNSPQICDELAKKDNRIKVIHKENGGLSSSRNFGLDICKGEYVGFVDSDDYIAVDMYEILIKEINRTSSDVAMVLYQEVKSDIPVVKAERKKKKSQIVEKPDIERFFLQKKIDSVCVGLYSRAAIGKQRFVVGKTSEDIPFNFEVLKKISRLVVVPKRKYFYYYNPNSISNGALDINKLNYLYFRKKINEYYEQKNDYELYELSGVLVARAAMGLMTRMALYGAEKSKDEKNFSEILKREFSQFRKQYYASKDIAFSRKILGVLVFKFYPIMKLLREVRK